MPVHLYGNTAEMDFILKFAKEHNLKVIEDASQGVGVHYKGRHVGKFGDIGVLSYYGNKTITTGEGGMVCTNEENVYQKLRILRSHGLLRESSSEIFKKEIRDQHPDLNPEFIFTHMGFNMRNTEIGGILGKSQLSRLSENIDIRTRNLKTFLSGINDDIYQTDGDNS